MARGDSYQLQGQQGGVVLSSGDSQTANFRWLQVINDTVLNALGPTNLDSEGSLVGPTLPAGVGIGGKFTSISVTSGIVIAYYA